MSTVGAYATMAEKLRIEKKHVCSEQMTLGKPAASVPFN
jgi:hypothetical protein